MIEKSHVWLDAWDQWDATKFAEPLGPTFILFEDARYITKELLLARLKMGADKQLPKRTRTWDDERTYFGDSIAVFIGHAIENLPPQDGKPATTQDGYNTVVWTRENNQWVIGHWQWSRAGLDAERDRWNDVYRQGRGFNQQPNQLLVDTIKGRKPGTALDLGMGQGRNALHLASQGWKTTGVDVATEGLRIAREEAAHRKLKNFTAIEADMEKYDFGTAKWDLVTMIYEGTDHKLVERIKTALKPACSSPSISTPTRRSRSQAHLAGRRASWRRCSMVGKSCATMWSRTTRTGAGNARRSSYASWRRSANLDRCRVMRW